MESLLIVWIAASVIIGIIGVDKKIGFFSAFSHSLFLSPITGLVLTLQSDSKDLNWFSRGMIQLERIQERSLKTISENSRVSILKTSVADSLNMYRSFRKSRNFTLEFEKLALELARW